ncbi:MAG TPA: hypothetical protein PK511_02185 [Chitinophagales bacterium]|nr:hypothetical protein [Chitinophagales bacterium]HMU69759.1 hypothetical protein [Chitinophagales bacterium]HMX03331.1 hypothetical protein [Chitinophagales bacterium]HMZ87971.1 hypothetical protein [Chitinophagales bacterium]HNA58422.1 hypothetical protein [Chitinophagales bacterium]
MQIKIGALLAISILMLHACKESADNEDTAAIENVGEKGGDNSLQELIDKEATTPDVVKQASGDQVLYNERFDYTITIPGFYTIKEKSNNGDGYFISSGDKDVDIRVYGENIADNQVMAEMELNTCESKTSFQFSNGYPGILCMQSDDRYYYYDTPKTRVTVYVHAPTRWFDRNNKLLDIMVKSLVVGKGGF